MSPQENSAHSDCTKLSRLYHDCLKYFEYDVSLMQAGALSVLFITTSPAPGLLLERNRRSIFYTSESSNIVSPFEKTAVTAVI